MKTKTNATNLLTKPEWEEEFEDGWLWRWDGRGFGGKQGVKSFIRRLLLKQKQEMVEKINNLITAEILIAQKEGQPTSRLTSLVVKLEKYDKRQTN